MRVDYVLGTSAGGTQRHVRMLADGLAARGVTVSVYGPAATWTAADPHLEAAPSAPERPGPAGDVPAETRSGAAQDVSAETRSGAAGDVSAETSGHPGPPRFSAVEIADRPRPSRDLAAIRRLRRLLASSRPDVVHAHGLRAGALAALAVGGRRASARPALLVTVHNAPLAAGWPRPSTRCSNASSPAGPTRCCASPATWRRGCAGSARAAWPGPWCPPRPARPAFPAGTPARLRAELGLASDPAATSLILAVARLAPQKGLGTLVAAAAVWRDRYPAPLLVIAGEGPLQADLARRAAAVGVRARFLGHRDDVPVLLAAADVVVLPSVWEGQPLIVQETLHSQAAGRLAGGIPDLTGEDAALLVSPGDPGALAAAVLTVLDDPVLAKRLSEAALQRSRSLPSEQDALDAAMATYHRVAPA